jgi:hypothetical protein
MSSLVLAAALARLLLAAVFAVAGIGKLLDLGGARRAAQAFGAGDRVAVVVAPLLALAELAVAAGLLVNATAWWAAAGAVMLLALFSIAVARALWRGEAPDCHCFGRLHSAPVGRGTLVRNGLLAAVAAVVLARGPDAAQALSPTAVVVAAGAGVALLVGWLVVELLRRNGRQLARIDQLELALSAAGLEIPDAGPVATACGGPAPGDPAPFFVLPGLDGRQVTSAGLLAPGRPLVLLFASPSCRPCRVVLRRLAEWRAAGATDLTVAVVGEGGAEAWHALPAELRPDEVLLQHDREIADLYGADRTPAAIVIDADGTVAGPPALGAAEVVALLARPPRDARPAPPAAPLLVQPPTEVTL